MLMQIKLAEVTEVAMAGGAGGFYGGYGGWRRRRGGTFRVQPKRRQDKSTQCQRLRPSPNAQCSFSCQHIAPVPIYIFVGATVGTNVGVADIAVAVAIGPTVHSREGIFVPGSKIQNGVRPQILVLSDCDGTSRVPELWMPFTSAHRSAAMSSDAFVNTAR